MDSISQVIHNCEPRTAIKPLDYITLPQIHHGKLYMLTMIGKVYHWMAGDIPCISCYCLEHHLRP